MTMILDGTSGITTPGIVNSAGETIATTLAVTGVSTFAAGSALLPAITTTGDTNTGVWFPAADTVAVSTGGTEVMRITSDGRMRFISSSSYTGQQNARIQWVNENSAGVMAQISCVREADALAPGALTFYTSPDVDTNTYTPLERMRIDSSGNLFVGTTSTIAATLARVNILNINGGQAGITIGNAGGSSSTGSIFFANSTGVVGSVVTNGSVTAFNTSSDYRLKEAIDPMTGALDKVALLKPVTFKWKVDGSDGQGFIAHELAEVVPDCVTGKKDATALQQVEVSPAVTATFDAAGNILTPAIEAVFEEREVLQPQGVDTSFLVATLTAAIQEQQALITAMTARLTALEAK